MKNLTAVGPVLTAFHTNGKVDLNSEGTTDVGRVVQCLITSGMLQVLDERRFSSEIFQETRELLAGATHYAPIRGQTGAGTIYGEGATLACGLGYQLLDAGMYHPDGPQVYTELLEGEGTGGWSFVGEVPEELRLPSGSRVVLIDLIYQSRAKMDEAIKKIEAEGSEVIGFICLLDISDPFESIADLDLEFYAHETLSYDADHDFARNRLREDGPDSVLEAYRKNGCIHGREGGDMFVGTSGRVFEHYFDKRGLDEHSLRRFAGELVEVALENDPTLPEQNIALMPLANGALRLGGFIFEELRKVMKTGKVEHLPTCKDENGDVHLHPDYDPATSGKVLFIEDNLTGGGSVLKEVKKVNDLGGENYATWSLLAKNDRTWQEMAKDQGMDGEEIGNFLTLQRYDMITYDRSEVSGEWKKKKKINTSHGWGKQIWEDVAKRREWQAAGFTFDCE